MRISMSFWVVAAAILLHYAVHWFLRRPFKTHGSGIMLVTGTSSGIGRHSAVALARMGYTVFGTVRKESDAVLLRDVGLKNLEPLILDVAKSEDIEHALNAVTDAMAAKSLPFIGLVNNAGVGKELPLEVQSMENIRFVFEVNVFGATALTKAFVPLLRKSSGRIVNIGSVAGLTTALMKGTYAATKHAMEALSDAWRMELQHWGISVSLIEPAYVKSQIAAKQTGNNAVFKKLPTEQQLLYAHIFDTFEEKRLKADSFADSCEVTTEAIVHALTNEYPKTRYIVANVNGVPAWLVFRVLKMLPDRLVDRLKGAL